MKKSLKRPAIRLMKYSASDRAVLLIVFEAVGHFYRRARRAAAVSPPVLSCGSMLCMKYVYCVCAYIIHIRNTLPTHAAAGTQRLSSGQGRYGPPLFPTRFPVPKVPSIFPQVSIRSYMSLFCTVLCVLYVQSGCQAESFPNFCGAALSIGMVFFPCRVF